MRPPSVLPAPPSSWERLLAWITAPGGEEVHVPMSRLCRIREDFAACLEDISSARAALLRQRIARAATLRDLWHLRADVFNAVSVHRSQDEAERRLADLNRHFTGRHGR